MKIRILFPNYVDFDNFNAQSLNAIEIARRLNPGLFQSTLFYERIPHPSLVNRASIRLVKLPSRLGTLKILTEFFRGQDIIFRANLINFTYLFFMMPRCLRRGAKMVEWFECPAENFLHEPDCLKELYRYIVSMVPDRVTMSQFIAESNLQNLGLASAGLIPVGVDTQLFVPPSSRNNDVPIVLFVGTLCKRKRPELVLEAARLFPGAKFILVGAQREDYYQVLERMASEWDLKNVTFVPPMPHSQLIPLMQKCDIALLPSDSEGVGKVLLEAGATGMPGLIFAHFKSPAVIDGVTGFQVNSSVEMIDRLNLLLNNRELRLRMGNAAIDYARKFDWDIITKQWEKKFIEIITDNVKSNISNDYCRCSTGYGIFGLIKRLRPLFHRI